MREIKYRAWNVAKKVMTYASFYQIRTHQVPAFHTLGDFKFMQYTGLKDKNGKEIYEGDILPEQWVVMWWPEQAQFVLGNGSLDVNKAAKEEFVIGLLNSDEVLGNIHEHPKLLEQQ